MMASRGEIINKARSQQIINYNQLRWGQITPTDLDGLLDFGGEQFVLLEYKYSDAPMPRGQELAIENLIRAIRAGGKDAIAIVGQHESPIEEEIQAYIALVRKYFWGNRWNTPRRPYTVKELIDLFLQLHNKTGAEGQS